MRRALYTVLVIGCTVAAPAFAGPAGAVPPGPSGSADARCHHAEGEPAALARRVGARRARSAAIRAMRCALGRVRARHRVAPLRWSPALARAAQRYARDMVRREYFSHTTPEGVELVDRLRSYAEPTPTWWMGEALAWGSGPRSRPIDVLRQWLHSPPHRRVLLTARARDVGIGVAFGAPSPSALPRRSATYVLELAWRDRGRVR